MADLLDRTDIESALASLPGWSYDGEALVKTVDVPEDSRDALVEAVGVVSDELDHHPDTSAEDGSLRFRLWTHSDGGVTSKDVELAARIDQVLSGAGWDAGSDG
jgi:4a-hydroxytetrahydrobiopterin dehydratase